MTEKTLIIMRRRLVWFLYLPSRVILLTGTPWRRFQDYVGKLKSTTDDEKLSYFQGCLKDPIAQDIVADSIRSQSRCQAIFSQAFLQAD